LAERADETVGKNRWREVHAARAPLTQVKVALESFKGPLAK
jgi:hypothetical protein